MLLYEAIHGQLIFVNGGSTRIRWIMPHGPKRVYDAALFRDEEIRRVLDEEHIRLISWKTLMQAQRHARG